MLLDKMSGSALMKGGLASVIIKFSSIFVGLISGIVMARALSVEQFGIYSMIFAMVSLMATPAQSGLPNLVVRETASAHALPNWARLKGIWQWATRFVAVTSFVMILVGFGMAMFIQLPDVGTFLLGLLLIPLISLSTIRGASLRGLQLILWGLIPDQVMRPTLFLLLIALLWWIQPTAVSASEAMLLHVIAAATAFIFGTIVLFRERPIEVRANSPVKYETSLWLKSIGPLLLIASFQRILEYADVLMVGYMASESEAALIRVASQGASLVAFGLSAVGMIAGPLFAKYHAQKKREELQRTATQAALVAVALATVPFLLLSIWPDAVLRLLFGAGYTSASMPLRILSVAQLVNAMTGCVGLLLVMTSLEKTRALALVGVVLTNVALNAVLIPPFGTSGAALATAIAVVLNNLVMWAVTMKILKVDSSILSVVRMFVSSPNKPRHP